MENLDEQIKTKKQELANIEIDKYSQVDVIKKKQKKERSKTLALVIVLFVFTILFLVSFILFAANVFSSLELNFQINNLIILISTICFIGFAIPSVIYLVKYIVLIRWTHKDELRHYKEFDI